MASNEVASCPFCGFKESNDYRLLLHVELKHSETGDSPFAIRDEPATSDLREEQEPMSGTSTPAEADYVECPHKCGEHIHPAELQLHVDLHLAEGMAMDEGITNMTNRHSDNTPKNDDRRGHRQDPKENREHRPKRNNSSWRDLLFSPQKRRRSPAKEVKLQDGKLRRLGKAELGPYANEKRMPSWLVRLLEDGGKLSVSNKIGPDGRLMRVETISNETLNLIPVLARLSHLDQDVSRAFYCDPRVRHIAKLPREGGFCGYRNIQMLLSYIQGAQAPGSHHFKGRRPPSILRLQELIEEAWDKGFNPAGREETGGILMTRKYIGTPEAQALLLSLEIAAEATAFSADKRGEAYAAMISAICEYFDDASTASNTDKVVITNKPPIYFQHQGHSMTIVGVEVDEEGSPCLIVFDPMYNTNQQLKDLASTNNVHFSTNKPAKLLKLHRRDEKHLAKYKAFEMIRINGPV